MRLDYLGTFLFEKKKALEDFWDILPLAEFLKIDKIIPLNFKFENIHDSERYIDLNKDKQIKICPRMSYKITAGGVNLIVFSVLS